MQNYRNAKLRTARDRAQRASNVSGRDTESEIKNVVEIFIQRQFLFYIFVNPVRSKAARSDKISCLAFNNLENIMVPQSNDLITDWRLIIFHQITFYTKLPFTLNYLCEF